MLTWFKTCGSSAEIVVSAAAAAVVVIKANVELKLKLELELDLDLELEDVVDSGRGGGVFEGVEEPNDQSPYVMSWPGARKAKRPLLRSSALLGQPTHFVYWRQYWRGGEGLNTHLIDDLRLYGFVVVSDGDRLVAVGSTVPLLWAQKNLVNRIY